MIALAIALAAGVQRPGYVMGFGLTTCGSWTADQASVEDEDKIRFLAEESWMEGFLSGENSIVANQKSGDFLVGTDFPAAKAWISNYCKAHPLETLTEAGKALTVELLKREIEKKSQQ